MKIKIKIILLYFLIGFVSDLILNVMSRWPMAPASVKALKYYFDRKTNQSAFWRHSVSGINAGLTIVCTLIPTMVLSHFIFGFTHPQTLQQLWRFILIAFGMGYAADVIIYKLEPFGDTLQLFYKLAGVGLWGALAFIFSILVGYVLMIL